MLVLISQLQEGAAINLLTERLSRQEVGRHILSGFSIEFLPAF
jgi:hypothetical protein